MKKSFYLLLTTFLAVTLASQRARAQDYLLIINDANPAAVTFTATLNDPTISNSTHLYSQGITLAGFEAVKNALIPAFSAVSSTLATGVDGGPDFNRTQSASISGTFADLQLYSSGSAATENFSTATPAFTGTATFDFSSFAADLPAAGTTGAIYTGSGAIFTGTPVVIGSYEVVQSAPEPGVTALLLVSAALCGIGLYRKSRASSPTLLA